MLQSIIGEWPQIILDQPESLAVVHLKAEEPWSCGVWCPLLFLLSDLFLSSSPSTTVFSPICFSTLFPRLSPHKCHVIPAQWVWGTWGPLLMVTNDWLCCAEKREKSIAEERRAAVHVASQRLCPVHRWREGGGCFLTQQHMWNNICLNICTF